jgi:hypothetical protein
MDLGKCAAESLVLECCERDVSLTPCLRLTKVPEVQLRGNDVHAERSSLRLNRPSKS